jgi:hypothetical protein
MAVVPPAVPSPIPYPYNVYGDDRTHQVLTDLLEGSQRIADGNADDPNPIHYTLGRITTSMVLLDLLAQSLAAPQVDPAGNRQGLAGHPIHHWAIAFRASFFQYHDRRLRDPWLLLEVEFMSIMNDFVVEARGTVPVSPWK